jgi:hypothetical protein
VEKKWWFKSHHQRVRNYSAWIVLRNNNPPTPLRKRFEGSRGWGFNNLKIFYLNP